MNNKLIALWETLAQQHYENGGKNTRFFSLFLCINLDSMYLDGDISRELHQAALGTIHEDNLAMGMPSTAAFDTDDYSEENKHLLRVDYCTLQAEILKGESE